MSSWHDQTPVAAREISFDIGLVGAVALVRRFQMWPAALIQLRRIRLYPAPDATGIHGNAAFQQKFGDVLVRERVSQIPADAKQDHLTGEMAPFERIRRGDWHGLFTLPDPFSKFAMEPQMPGGRDRLT